MKAGLFNKRCTILRKKIVTGDYRDKEVWEPIGQTKVNFVWTAGDRRIEQPTKRSKAKAHKKSFNKLIFMHFNINNLFKITT